MGSSSRRVIRSCVACRGKEVQGTLLRFFWKKGVVEVDAKEGGLGCTSIAEAHPQGRGAYLHRSAACWHKVRDGKRMKYALRVPVTEQVRWTEQWRYLDETMARILEEKI